MNRIIVAVALFSLFSVQVFALSCMRPEAERTASRYAAMGHPFAAIEGTMSLEREFQSYETAKEGTYKHPEENVSAIVKGINLLTDEPFEETITVVRTCIGPWCGSTEKEFTGLIFMTETEDGYAVSLSACGGSLFPSPQGIERTSFLACLKNSKCDLE